MPNTPSSPKRLASPRGSGMVPASNHSATLGASSASAKARTASRMSRSSEVSERSTARKSAGSGAGALCWSVIGNSSGSGSRPGPGGSRGRRYGWTGSGAPVSRPLRSGGLRRGGLVHGAPLDQAGDALLGQPELAQEPDRVLAQQRRRQRRAGRGAGARRVGEQPEAGADRLQRP